MDCLWKFAGALACVCVVDRCISVSPLRQPEMENKRALERATGGVRKKVWSPCIRTIFRPCVLERV